VVAPMLEDGPTEAAFALELDTEMRRQGADDLSFETIVAAGPKAPVLTTAPPLDPSSGATSW
jgi:Xaa-Pro aminopeptidase